MESKSNLLENIYFLSNLHEIFLKILEFFPKKNYFLFTDSNLFEIYNSTLSLIFQKENIQIKTFILNSGEHSKSRENIEKAEDFLFRNNCERSDVLISLGGGMVCDFTGFLSSIYMRGVIFLEIPTSILAMVDASIGSKTAINTPFGKNLIGSFYDARNIFICIDLLNTLDKRNWANGFAEIIKIAIVFDKEFFEKLKRNSLENAIGGDLKIVEEFIRKAMELKLEVVAKDKKEGGLRKWLNFGHTVGHGLEFVMMEEMLHGECVAIGMVKEIELGEKLFWTKKGVLEELIDCLMLYDLPLEIPERTNTIEMIKKMSSDKKNISKEIHFAPIKDIGVPLEKTFSAKVDEIIEIISDSYVIEDCSFNINEMKEFNLPGSKSIANRVLLMAALGETEIVIENIPDSEDVLLMISALTQLKACEINKIGKKTYKIKGKNGNIGNPSKIYVGNSGTCARFLTAFSMLSSEFVQMDCSSRMKSRPMIDLISALKKCNDSFSIEYLEKADCLPYRIRNGSFQGGEIFIKSKTSSQFISAVLMISPLAEKTVKITLSDVQENEKLVSEPFVEMTVEIMKKFGIKVIREGNCFIVEKSKYILPSKFLIEGDAAGMAFGVAQIALLGGKIKANVPENSLQGDSKFPYYLQKINPTLEIKPNKEFTEFSASPIKPIPLTLQIDLNEVTDCFLAFAVVCCQAYGVFQIINIANQSAKECERLHFLVKNLQKIGIFCRELPTGVEIYARNLSDWESFRIVEIDSQDDHRMAMAFAVLGAYLANRTQGALKLEITQKYCVAKTFPGFWKQMQEIFNLKCGSKTNYCKNYIFSFFFFD